jgi:hypothetical protein
MSRDSPKFMVILPCPSSRFNLYEAREAGGLVRPLGERLDQASDADLNPMEGKTGGGCKGILLVILLVDRFYLFLIS